MQVTKLCDLGIDDSVCSVGWAQRGTHLAVGTSNGKVQVSHDLFKSMHVLAYRLQFGFFFFLQLLWKFIFLRFA